MKICLDTLLPTFSTIYQLMSNGVNFDFGMAPINFYNNFICDAIISVQTACESQIQQAISVLLAAVKPMLSLIGKGLDFFPTIFGLPIRLFDLIDMNIKDLINIIPKDLLKSLVDLLLPSLNLDIGELNTLEAVYYAVKNYFVSYLLILQNLINEVVDFLNISAFTLPTIPTPQQIMQRVFQILGVYNLQELLDKGISLYEAFISALSSFGIPFSLVDNFLSYLNSVQVEYTTLLNNSMSQCINSVMAVLLNFIENVLKNFMTFTFPSFCFEVPYDYRF